MLESGDVVLTKVQFTDTFEIKRRPAVVLFEEMNNVVIAGITSNLNMVGIPLSKEDGAIKESVIKLNYIFTVSNQMVERVLFKLNQDKKEKIFEEMNKKLRSLKD